jgi:hypothetical protein
MRRVFSHAVAGPRPAPHRKGPAAAAGAAFITPNAESGQSTIQDDGLFRTPSEPDRPYLQIAIGRPNRDRLHHTRRQERIIYKTAAFPVRSRANINPNDPHGICPELLGQPFRMRDSWSASWQNIFSEMRRNTRSRRHNGLEPPSTRRYGRPTTRLKMPRLERPLPTRVNGCKGELGDAPMLKTSRWTLHTKRL